MAKVEPAEAVVPRPPVATNLEALPGYKTTASEAKKSLRNLMPPPADENNVNTTVYMEEEFTVRTESRKRQQHIY